MFTKLVILKLLVTIIGGARILGIVPTPAYSHQTSLWPIWKELSLRGHQVTLLTTDPINDSQLVNLRQIELKNSYGIIHHVFERLHQLAPLELLHELMNCSLWLLKHQLKNSEVRELIHNKTMFDAVMVESIFPEYLAFSELYNASKILVSSLDTFNIVYSQLGNPIHYVAHPEYMLPLYGKLSFLERVKSTLVTWYLDHTRYKAFQVKEKIIRQYFGQRIPPIKEMIKDVDLLLLNVNPIFHDVRAVGPTVINFGGAFHIRPPKSLPKDLKKYLDDAKEGVIYFSLGSNVKSGNLNENKMSVILETLGELPYKVLWKFEKETLSGKPDNIKLIKWAPQQDVLRHPNIKLFVTQGGLQSLEEALFNYVPMVVLPFFGDQASNGKRIEQKGIGKVVVHQPSISKSEFKSAIIEVIQNPKYRENMKELVRLALDQPMSGIDKVVWWTEYVIRNKGAKHLRNPIVDLPLYQYYLLDVFAFIICSIAIILYLLKLMIKFVIRSVYYLRNLKSIPIVKKTQ